jgi:queuine tRNA-ribosyltransferase
MLVLQQTQNMKIIHKDKYSNARAGEIETDHGIIKTPIFMPVGTQATVKSLTSFEIEALDPEIILANTYHLHLRPNEGVIKNAGGLHKFMNIEKPILTDSGGFQIFSLQGQKLGKKNLVKSLDDGVTFYSHLDGSKHFFDPKGAIEIEHKLGADIIMAFDECTKDGDDYKTAKFKMEKTHRWAVESLIAHQNTPLYHGYNQQLFGIVQGGIHNDLKIESLNFIQNLDFDGIAMGGESIGFNMEYTREILAFLSEKIDRSRPLYTMGVTHSPRDMFDVIEHGVDMFDCVSPTRMARNGVLFVPPWISTNYRINILNSQFKEDFSPISEYFEHDLLTGYSKSYLHHLFKADEMTAATIATTHNLNFLLSLCREIREAILNDEFLNLKNKWVY